MLVQFFSDIHLEHYVDKINNDEIVIPVSDILIMAGDICHYYKYDLLKEFVKDMCKKFKLVIYVLGNHEYYYDRTGIHEKNTMEEIFSKISELEKEFSNLYILNEKTIDIGNDICIVGCTLWSSCLKVPDFIVRIHDMNTKLYNDLHEKNVKYLQKIINYCEKNKKKLIIVTHHCPDLNLMPIKNKFRTLYATDMSSIMNSECIKAFIFGHIHKNVDYIHPSGVHIVGNMKGKIKDNITDYDPKKTINI